MIKPTRILLDREYNLVWDFNAMVLFETLTGKNAFGDLTDELKKASGARAILYSAMISGGEKVELEKIGSLLSMQNMVSLSEALGKMLAASYGQSDEVADEKK